jgi:AraC-like DNA-binding protein
LTALAAELRSPGGLPFFTALLITDRELLGRFLAAHQRLGSAVSAMEGDSLLIGVLAELVARHAGGRLAPLTNREHPSVHRARDYLDTHYADNISLHDLARQAGLSPFYLHRTFSRQVGLPPHAYQAQTRIARAKTLLLEGLAIADVAAQTDFADQSHFTRQFRRWTGVAPGRYITAPRTGKLRMDNRTIAYFQR